MFVPEFVLEDRGEFVLVANHNLETPESIRLSIKYNAARIAFGKTQLPPHIQGCRIIYDIRGQSVSNEIVEGVKQALASSCSLEFKR